MLKTHWKIISWLERVADNAVIIVAFFFTYALRDTLLREDFLQSVLRWQLPLLDGLNTLGPIKDYFIVLGFALPLFNAILSILGAYRSMRFSSHFKLFKLGVIASAVVFLSLSSLFYMLKLDLSRSFVGIFCFLSGLFIFLERAFVVLFLRVMRVRGRNFRNVLIVGTGEHAKKIAQEILKQPELGVRVVQSMAYDDLLEFEQALKRYAVDEVVFTETVRYFVQVEELSQVAYEEGVSVSLVADLFSLDIFRSDLSYLGSFPIIHYRRSYLDSPLLIVKRVFDVVFAGFLLIVLAPLLILVAIAIKLSSPGPIFFRQQRVGLNGRKFILLKFRSMIDGSEHLMERLKRKNEMSGPVFKIKKDPRVTKLGRFIRKYSIDELPQLFNVIKGDMSLVGPRPPLPDEVSRYERRQRRRLSMRPGLTCIWQVSGRNNILDFDEWAKLDLEYIDNWSLKKDFQLILKTIPVVLTGFGAR
jgi:exopolysaccharide biosynthesis polyprenyl glycosylphosphotransferase